MDWKFVPPPPSYFETLIPNVLVFGGVALEGKEELSWMGLIFLEKKSQEKWSVFLSPVRTQ